MPELPALDGAAIRVGDRWTLLLLAALLDGPLRFNELADVLVGVAPNVLSKRLRALEADGLIASSPYSRRPLRVAYGLTDAGNGLADALRLLARWGAEHPAPGTIGVAEESMPDHHVDCGTTLELRWWCPTCDRLVDPDDDATHLRWL